MVDGNAEPRSAATGLRDAEGLVGRTVAGKYRVHEVLAKGGMGRIYRAEQVPLGRPVALKVLHSELDETGGDPGFQKRFLLERSVRRHGQLLMPGKHSFIHGTSYNLHRHEGHHLTKEKVNLSIKCQN